VKPLFATAAAIGLAYGWFALEWPKGWLRAIWKTLPVALLAAAAHFGGAPQLLVLALVFAAVGDGFLAFEGQRYFLAGLAAFLICHLAYAFVFSAGQNPQWSAGVAFFAGTAAIFGVTIAAYRHLRPALGPMRLPVGVYCGVIAAMAVAAWSRGPEPVLLAGVGLFMASDLVLAMATFRLAPHSPWRQASERLIWFAYLAAQLLITGAFLFG
jgi:uncharacterized membrane protein YhhN